jgi:mannose-1-phosphate guanylyltransferase
LRSHPASDLVNAGIYAFQPEVLNLIEGRPPKDIGFDLLPRLVGQARAMVIDGYFRDIGTPESYWTAQMDWKPRTLR